MFAPASNNPQKKQSESPAERVDEDIPDGRLARGNEGLVKFIARGVKRNGEQGETGLGP